MQDQTLTEMDPGHFFSTSQYSFDRKPMDDLERGSAGVESVPYEMLFGHGKVNQAEARASNAEASMSEIHYTKPNFDKRAAHAMAWVGEKDNDLTMPAISQPRRDLLKEKQAKWNHEVTCDVHGTSVSSSQFKDPNEQPLQHFKSEPRKPRANLLGRSLGSSHLQIGLRK